MNFIRILIFDLYLNFIHKGTVLNNLIFFSLICFVFPFAIDSNSKVSNIGIAVIWINLIISSILSANYIYSEDYEDGTLMQYFISGTMAEAIVIAKLISSWLSYILPILLIIPILSNMYNLSEIQLYRLIISILIASPIIILNSSFAASLTIGLKRTAAINGILLLPLYIPIIILGIDIATSNIINNDYVYLLLAIFILELPIIIFFNIALIRQAIKN